jgi:hypothetical protein
VRACAAWWATSAWMVLYERMGVGDDEMMIELLLVSTGTLSASRCRMRLQLSFKNMMFDDHVPGLQQPQLSDVHYSFRLLRRRASTGVNATPPLAERLRTETGSATHA